MARSFFKCLSSDYLFLKERRMGEWGGGAGRGGREGERDVKARMFISTSWGALLIAYVLLNTFQMQF